MGSIPLVALDAQVPTPQNPLDAQAKAQALRTGQQQQQLNQFELQKQQLALKDQDAMTKAMQAWDGKDIGELPGLAIKHGASAQTVFATQQHVYDLKTKAATMQKDQLAAEAARRDADLGTLKSLDDVPDEQFGQHLTSLIQSGQIDPQHAGLVQGLTQMPVGKARDQLKIIEKGLLGEKEQFSQAQAQKETEAKAADLALRTKEFQATMPGGAKEPVEQKELSAYLANPALDKGLTKDAATFAAWKAKQNPAAQIITSNMLGAGGQGSALDQAAQRYSTTGELPPGFARSPGTTAAIVKRAAQLNPEANIAANKATFSADTAALKKLTTQAEQVNAFEGTAIKNLDLFLEKARAVPDLGARFANVPFRMITGQMIGTENQAALQAARQTALTETAKVLNSATASGVLSDSARKEVDELLSGNLPLPAMIKTVETLKQDMQNRHQSYADDIAAIKQRMGGGEAPPATTPAPPATTPATDFFSKFGGKAR